MDNLWLVIKREYITRVRRKSFLLATLLTPLGLAVFVIVAQFIFSYDNDEQQKIAIVDEGGIIAGAIPDDDNLYFEISRDNIDSLKTQVQESRGEYSAILVIPKITNPRSEDVRVDYFSDGSLAINTKMAIERRLEKVVRNYKIETLGLDRDALSALETDVDIRTKKITVAEGEDADTSMASAVGAGLGTVMGFLMYLSIFIYGTMVMRSVMEEKTNRIVEVVISTVRPTTLLLGKIIGVGAVGLTQIVAWMILIPGMLFLVGLFFGLDADTAQQMPQSPDIDPVEMQSTMEQIFSGLATLNWWVIIPCFILYFLGGFFMYAALFAAVGSAMGDDLGEGQALTIPITIPVILALYVMMAAIQAPNSSLAIGGSLFPLSAPIVMPARLAFEPPVWQVILSLLITLATALGLVWLAGRIYRVGILNYGKKSSLADMGRWIFSKY